MTCVHSFAPVVDERAHTLVLGSMPGVLSLTARQYYAHPQNAFWKIVETLFGVARELPYEQRLAALQAQGIALWDVLGSCVRAGSLDSDIVESTIEPNDLPGLLRAHPRIRRVFFNGAKAQASFERHVRWPDDLARPSFARLPSTSPAHASLRFADKLAAWSVLRVG